MNTKTQSTEKKVNRKGFSLIELMVVLIILGLIAAIVIPRTGLFTKKGSIQAAKQQITALKAALEAFRADMGRYPTSDEGLKALIENPDANNPNYEQNGYLDKKKVPKDPWTNEYIYKSPGDHSTDYDISSKGPDGQVGTNDDINSWE